MALFPDSRSGVERERPGLADRDLEAAYLAARHPRGRGVPDRSLTVIGYPASRQGLAAARADDPELAGDTDRDVVDLDRELSAPAHRPIRHSGRQAPCRGREGLPRSARGPRVGLPYRGRRRRLAAEPQAAEDADRDDQRRRDTEARLPPATAATAGRRQWR